MKAGGRPSGSGLHWEASSSSNPGWPQDINNDSLINEILFPQSQSHSFMLSNETSIRNMHEVQGAKGHLQVHRIREGP